jgi:hypothetical protein
MFWVECFDLKMGRARGGRARPQRTHCCRLLRSVWSRACSALTRRHGARAAVRTRRAVRGTVRGSGFACVWAGVLNVSRGAWGNAHWLDAHWRAGHHHAASAVADQHGPAGAQRGTQRGTQRGARCVRVLWGLQTWAGGAAAGARRAAHARVRACVRACAVLTRRVCCDRARRCVALLGAGCLQRCARRPGSLQQPTVGAWRWLHASAPPAAAASQLPVASHAALALHALTRAADVPHTACDRHRRNACCVLLRALDDGQQRVGGVPGGQHVLLERGKLSRQARGGAAAAAQPCVPADRPAVACRRRTCADTTRSRTSCPPPSGRRRWRRAASSMTSSRSRRLRTPTWCT